MSEHLLQKDVAIRLGVLPRQIRNLREQGMPFDAASKRFPWPECLQWYITHKTEAEVERRMPKERTELDQREQLARIRIAEIRVLREEAKVVPIGMHRRRYREATQQFSAVIRSLPQWAPELVVISSVPEMTVALERIANEQLRLARGEDALALEEEDGDLADEEEDAG